MQNTKKIIIDNNSGNGVVPYLPLPELRNRAQSNSNIGETR